MHFCGFPIQPLTLHLLRSALYLVHLAECIARAVLYLMLDACFFESGIYL